MGCIGGKEHLERRQPYKEEAEKPEAPSAVKSVERVYEQQSKNEPSKQYQKQLPKQPEMQPGQSQVQLHQSRAPEKLSNVDKDYIENPYYEKTPQGISGKQDKKSIKSSSQYYPSVPSKVQGERADKSKIIEKQEENNIYCPQQNTPYTPQSQLQKSKKIEQKENYRKNEYMAQSYFHGGLNKGSRDNNKDIYASQFRPNNRQEVKINVIEAQSNLKSQHKSAVHRQSSQIPFEQQKNQPIQPVFDNNNMYRSAIPQRSSQQNNQKMSNSYYSRISYNSKPFDLKAKKGMQIVEEPKQQDKKSQRQKSAQSGKPSQVEKSISFQLENSKRGPQSIQEEQKPQIMKASIRPQKRAIKDEVPVEDSNDLFGIDTLNSKILRYQCS